MANVISLFQKYIDKLDAVYQQAATSSVLDTTGELVSAGANANEIVIPVMKLDGMADYSRNSGYVNGSAELSLETKKFNYDRGRAFNIDRMDNAETEGVAFGMLASEFIRTKAVPELDAVRYATYASTAGIGAATPATLADGNAVLAALQAAQSAMDEAEVSTESRHLFITPTNLNAAQNVDTTKSKEVLASFASINKVPQSRFYTGIELLDGKTAEETMGGFKKSTTGKDINFLIVEKSAVIQYGKHTVNKVISADDNQEMDAHKFPYRAYGITETYDNKVAGIYVHHKA